MSTTRRQLLKSSLLAGSLMRCSQVLSAALIRPSVAPIAQTRSGRVEGLRVNDVYVFKGIVYGQAQRFMAPVPPISWTDLRPALAYGPASPQSHATEAISEDCLYLNVWTPGLRDGAARPIMVYIHGGEYSSGSGSSPLCDGTSLCTQGDVVVITLNHRLSAFGYLYLGQLGQREFPDAGNAGMLDLILALQWVRDHAHEFGGDPQRVMVFGQSGGGAKIATLMAMPAARGLFHRAATMSGQQITAASPQAATRRADAFLQALQIETNDLHRLRDVPLEHLIAALATADPGPERRSIYFGPVLDERHLLRHPFYPDAPAQSAGIPMIIGNTREETRYFYANDASVQDLSWAELPSQLRRAVYVDIDVENVITEYRRWYPQYSPTGIFFAASTAGRSWRGAIIEAELRALQGAPVYAYQLDYRSPRDGGKWGACHTLDIPLVFGTLDQPGSLAGTDAVAKKVSAHLQTAFIRFAHSGNPNHRGLPHWRPYRLPKRETLVINSISQLQNDPRGVERELFAKVPYIQRGTF